MDLFLRFLQGCPGPLEDSTIELKVHKTKAETFPFIDECFAILTLPVCHDRYASFEQNMSKAILYDHEGYGKV